MYRSLIKSTNLPHSIHRAAFKQCSTRQLSHSSSAKHSSFKTSKLLIASLVPSIIIYNYLSSSSAEPIRNDEETKNIHYKDIPTHDLIEKTLDRANEQSKAASDAFAQKQAKLRQEKGLEDAAPSGSADKSKDGSKTTGISSQIRTKDSNAKQAADERQEGNYTRKPNKGSRKDKQVYEQEENKPKRTKHSKPVEESSSEGEQQEEGKEEGEQQEAAFNPETGEINWDCPCLGGMAHGPCGEEFKEAFSCFVFSETEPKGIDCIKKFENMRSCFKKHPDHYKEELYDDEKELDTKDVEHVVLEEADPAIKELKQGIDDGKVKK